MYLLLIFDVVDCEVCINSGAAVLSWICKKRWSKRIILVCVTIIYVWCQNVVWVFSQCVLNPQLKRYHCACSFIGKFAVHVIKYVLQSGGISRQHWPWDTARKRNEFLLFSTVLRILQLLITLEPLYRFKWRFQQNLPLQMSTSVKYRKLKMSHVRVPTDFSRSHHISSIAVESVLVLNGIFAILPVHNIFLFYPSLILLHCFYKEA